MAVKNGAYSLEEKREAVAYFNKNEVPKRIEQLLNKMFKEKPSDVFGYMVRKGIFVWFLPVSAVYSGRARKWCLYSDSLLNDQDKTLRLQAAGCAQIQSKVRIAERT